VSNIQDGGRKPEVMQVSVITTSFQSENRIDIKTTTFDLVRQ